MRIARVGISALLIMACGGCGHTDARNMISDHFDGKVFRNLEPTVNHGLWSVFKMLWSGERKEWPKWLDAPAGEKPPARVEGAGRLRYTFINHATMLIQVDGLNILTDPIFSERCSPVSFAGPRRVRAPGVELDKLPKIDIILVSHNHYDHMDLASLHRIFDRDRPKIFTGLKNEKLLRGEGFATAEEMDWWDARSVGDVKIHFVPAQHFSSRTPFDRNETLWGGFLLQSSFGNIYFAGDTGYGSFFKEIAQRFGPMNLSLIPIGAYAPRWFMGPIHLNPDEAVKAHLDLQSKLSVGIHFGTFQLSDESIDDPRLDLEKSMRERLVPPGQFVVPKFGEGVSLTR